MANMIARIQQLKNVPNSSYHDLKLYFSYHNNRFAGNSFTLLQLTSLVQCDQVEGPLSFPEMIANQNSLNLFDFIIGSLGQKLSKELLAEYYHILTKDSEIYECINIEERELQEILTWYNSLKTATLKDIAEFHYAWTSNYTFRNENGRIGRLLILKQCIENDITPFIIREEDEEEYRKALELHVEDLQELFGKCEKYEILY